jgi:outer membrane protein assembly factor BamB
MKPQQSGIILLFMLLMSLQMTAATSTSYSLAWEHQFEEGYITTGPVIFEGTVFVRTSGYWIGEERPKVTAFDFDGQLLWNYTNNASTQHDMAPLLVVEYGEGVCGSWETMLLVPWANGDLTAHNVSTGELVWNQSTMVDQWGLTGRALVHDDIVIVPTRHGLAEFCLADGSEVANYQLGLGWRNGVSKDTNGTWIGDENGILWSIQNGTVEQFDAGEGFIRHSPVITNGGVVIHLQTSNGSEILFFNRTSDSFTLLNTSGSSPGLPFSIDSFVVTTDSTHVRIFDCSSVCIQVDSIDSHSNGEVGIDGNNRIWVPQNVMKGGTLILSVNATGAIVSSSSFNTTLDGYSTASPAFSTSGDSIMVFGNDFGALRLYSQKNNVFSQEKDYDLTEFLLGFAFFLFVATCARFVIKGSKIWALRLLFTSLLISLLLVSPQLMTLLQESKPEALLQKEEELWSSDWPAEWNNTQVVIIDLPDGQIIDGGFTDYDTVYALTVAMAEKNNISIDVQEFYFGVFIEGFSGVTGNGWEFLVDGELGEVSADQSEMPASGILRWTLAS